MMIEQTWMQPYLAYMMNKTLPKDTVEARRILRRSKAFVILQGKLYKKSITGVLQRCVTPQEGQDILKDIHAGVCGHHASSRALAAKAFRAGKLHKSWPGGHVYMLVAVDKFTKWVEEAPVTTQDSTAAIDFIKSIVFRFGVPHNIITDNGTNFTSKEFKVIAKVWEPN
jgi:hypothetical protein